VVAARQLRRQDAALSLLPLPALPVPLVQPLAAVAGKRVALAGVDAAGHPQLWLGALGDAGAGWTVVPAWPGGGAASTLVLQTSALFVTVPDAAGDRLLRWKDGDGWRALGPVPGGRARLARPTGQAHMLYLVDGPAGAQLRTYQTITNAWADLPGVQAAGIRAGAAWKDGLAFVATDAGGAQVLSNAQIQSTKVLLRWVDWLVIIVYLGGMIGIGLYFYLREKRNSTANFFVGGRSIPFWAAGVSLYAANTSSISFIAIPAKAFETNWQYLTNNLIAVVGLMFVAVWIVPLLRRLDLMSVFSYLETRFHPGIRMMASALAILTQIGSRMSVILLLPALAISTITGINVTLSIVLMGGFTIIYTAMGGMKAVIWTDFVQVIVKMGGAIFAIGFMIWSLKGGFGQFWQQAQAEDKLHLLDFSFDLTKATVWGFLFLVLFDVVLTFPKDQVLMQRTLSTKSDKEAGKSIWAFAAIMIPGGFVFYGIGTALFVYYKNNPERMNPLLPIDATFPLFIGAELPPGVTGLIIAGIFAAAMATLSGIMNSVSTLVSVDFYERLRKDKSQKKSVFFAEMMTVLVGLIGIGVAIVLSKFDVHSLFDVSIELAGLLGGGFAGAYTLGMFTRRANSPGVAIGIAFSIVLTLVAWHYKLVHPYFYLAISILLCIVFGYLASLFFPVPTRSLAGLTIYARDKLPPREAAAETP
jgi:SSS family transporter